jgi:hypothetical protein
MNILHRIYRYRSYILYSCRTFISLYLLAALAFAWAPAAQAQQAENESATIYSQLDYMQVPPEQVGEYLSIEREIWKPMHQERANEGAIIGWQLYVVRYPGGTGHDYQYVTVTLYDSLTNAENPEYATYAQRVHSGVDANVAAQRTYDSRELVRSELWVQHDQAASETPSEPAPILQVDYMKVPSGGASNYLSHEQDVWKPIHQARIDAGLMRGWSVWQMVFPGGTGQRHNYGTANAYESISAIPNSFPEGIIEEVHPDKTPDEIFQEGIRELVHSELWELVDYVAGPATQTTSER